MWVCTNQNGIDFGQCRVACRSNIPLLFPSNSGALLAGVFFHRRVDDRGIHIIMKKERKKERKFNSRAENVSVTGDFFKKYNARGPTTQTCGVFVKHVVLLAGLPVCCLSPPS